MDIKSVSKPVVQAAPPPKRAEARSEPKPEDKPREPEARKAAQPPAKPVLNAQGHMTGRTLNVTA